MAKRADGKFQTEIVQTVYKNFTDDYAKDCPLHYGRRDPMSGTLLVVQALNGLQLGVLLFLVAPGLTLVFGVMDFVNMAHGVQYMLGAYLAVAGSDSHGQLRARPRWRLWRGRSCSAWCWTGSCSATSMDAAIWTRCSRPSGLS